MEGVFIKSENIGKIRCSLYCRAVCVTRNISQTQYPRFLIESGFKSRAGYNGACTVLTSHKLGNDKKMKALGMFNST